MRAAELRIGNFVNKGRITHLPMGLVHSLNEIGCNWYEYKLDQIKPIPLTEEWISKFNQESSFNFSSVFSCFFMNGEVYIEQYNEGAFPIKHIKYVHQLQNLYFALTGEELEYNG